MVRLSPTRRGQIIFYTFSFKAGPAWTQNLWDPQKPTFHIFISQFSSINSTSSCLILQNIKMLLYRDVRHQTEDSSALRETRTLRPDHVPKHPAGWKEKQLKPDWIEIPSLWRGGAGGISEECLRNCRCKLSKLCSLISSPKTSEAGNQAGKSSHYQHWLQLSLTGAASACRSSTCSNVTPGSEGCCHLVDLTCKRIFCGAHQELWCCRVWYRSVPRFIFRTSSWILLSSCRPSVSSDLSLINVELR